MTPSRRRMWMLLATPVVGYATYAALAWGLPAAFRRMAAGAEVPSRPLFEAFEVASVAFAPYAALFASLGWLVQLHRAHKDAQRLDRIDGIEAIRRLTWNDFERLLAEAFRRLGYRAELTTAGADGGIDLVLTGDSGRTLVQAKQWRSHKVGVDKIRELFGVLAADRSASQAILVTSGTATDPARTFARNNGLRLIEGDELAGMIRSVQPKPAPAPASPVPVSQSCPKCRSPMVRRTARRGANIGNEFWGCERFPHCREIVPI